MAIVPYLAMTAAEMRGFSDFSFPVAWMACHFSPYGRGLSNLPRELAPGSLLIVDDVTPPHSHDPEVIIQQLTVCIKRLQCSGVLLDFQRPLNTETALLAKQLSEALPCPTMVSDIYGKELNCPVFLSAVPPSVALGEHLAPWHGREIWLEAGLSGEELLLSESGCQVLSLTGTELPKQGFAANELHCHYSVQTNETSARFTLWRTEEDLKALLVEAEELGIVGTVGLFQELKNFDAP